jgi:hypothetical protein
LGFQRCICSWLSATEGAATKKKERAAKAGINLAVVVKNFI